MNRKYWFAVRRNCSNSDRGMKVNTLYLDVFIELSQNADPSLDGASPTRSDRHDSVSTSNVKHASTHARTRSIARGTDLLRLPPHRHPTHNCLVG
mmetsp:Transcript_2135/g.6529  ORF Transcript_2135/g.6529 Transcript_2135/m.6529 type:complete len:95 (-) Transcript_2135:9-293(-)